MSPTALEWMAVLHKESAEIRQYASDMGESEHKRLLLGQARMMECLAYIVGHLEDAGSPRSLFGAIFGEPR